MLLNDCSDYTDDIVQEVFQRVCYMVENAYDGYVVKNDD